MKAIAAPKKLPVVAQRMPKSLKEAYIRASEDDQLVSLKANLAELDARRASLYESLETRDSPKLWKQIIKLKETIARRERNSQPVDAQMRRLWAIIEQGAEAGDIYDEIYYNLELRRKMVESEQRRMKDLNAMFTVDQVARLAGNLCVLALKLFDSPQVRSKFLEAVEVEHQRSLSIRAETKAILVAPVEEDRQEEAV